MKHNPKIRNLKEVEEMFTKRNPHKVFDNTSIDWKAMIIFGIFLSVFIGSILFISHTLNQGIKEAGGLRQIIVDIGKEVKSIGEEIAEDANDQ